MVSALVDEMLCEQADRGRSDAAALDARGDEEVDPRVPKVGVVLFVVLDEPRELPSTSIAKAVASSSPRAFRSSSSRSGSPHQRATDGSLCICSTRSTSSAVSARTTTPSRSSLTQETLQRRRALYPTGVFMSVWSSACVNARL